MPVSYQYNDALPVLTEEACTVAGAYRILKLDGRKGINPLSIHTLIQYEGHNLNEEKGSLSYWVFSLEEVFTFLKRDVMFTEANRNPSLLPLLSDHPDLGSFEKAGFYLGYEATWHPAFLAKFYNGDVFLDAIRAPQKAYAMASAFEIERNRWYQFTMTWDFEAEEVFIYANGVRIACSDRFHTAFKRDLTGSTLYSGKPLYCFGELAFHDHALSPEQVRSLYQDSAISVDEDFQKKLRCTYEGENMEEFRTGLTEDWTPRLELDLKQSWQLDHFRVQGIAETVEITEDGLHIKTPSEPYAPDSRHRQMYLWTRDMFEGDTFVEFEFRPNQAFGLAVLVLQASGMNREDLDRDYPLRTSGNMHWIHSSDMRNYHIEYFRHMTAVRNDMDNVALIKNPYQWPMGFSCLEEVLEEHTWHKLQVLQDGVNISVALNGKKCFTAMDCPFGNNGPVLNAGRVALRCMINTDMHFRNFRLKTRDLPFRQID